MLIGVTPSASFCGSMALMIAFSLSCCRERELDEDGVEAAVLV